MLYILQLWPLILQNRKGFYQVISKTPRIYHVISKTSKTALENYTVYMWIESASPPPQKP